VVAPVWHCVELQAVGELHLVGLAKLLELLPSLLLPLAFLWRLFWGCIEFLKLKGLGGRSVTVRRQDVQGGDGAGSGGSALGSLQREDATTGRLEGVGAGGQVACSTWMCGVERFSKCGIGAEPFSALLVVDMGMRFAFVTAHKSLDGSTWATWAAHWPSTAPGRTHLPHFQHTLGKCDE
jgi:hypothetical protein